MASMGDLLNQLSNTDFDKKIDSAEIWEGLGKGKNYKELGFESEKDLSDWIEDNDYNDL